NTGKYVVSVAEREKDRIYLTEHGYHTVNTAALTEYVYHGVKLPEKPVLLSFDDGFESVYSLVRPLMQKYHMKCIASVIGSVSEMYSENPDHNITYSYMTWDEIKDLSRTREIEIHPHSYDMHYCENGKRKGMEKLTGESDGDYMTALYDDMYKIHSKLQQLGAADTAMVYPYGIYNSETEWVIKSLGYLLSFSCEEKPCILKRYDRSCLYRLGRYNRPSGVSSNEFFSFMKK
ncbi:MAG: polysaccharide deacetylase family protein, partial [Clostridia bacterium]|nr:polysaccharide deacetylase family protein [Clostridia bacterium]